MQQNYQCVTFGEILYDVLNDKKEVGGAPFNVAYHLHQLGMSTAMITKVGNDENGSGLKNFMQQKGLPADFVQTDNIHETSTVIASQSDTGEMSYTIKEPVAWDFIEHSEAITNVVHNADWFVFGSLSSRNTTTHDTLFQLLKLPVKKVFDINMRPPFVDRDKIERQLRLSDMVKMNDTEFDTLCAWNGIDSSEDALDSLIDKYALETIIVTKGKHGAFIYHEKQLYENNGYAVKVQDTIGCGDAFLAGIIYSFAHKIAPQEAIDFASKLGALVATRSGGTPVYTREDILSIA